MKFRTDLQKRSSLHNHFRRRRCRRRHMDGILSHVSPTYNSEKAILAFVGVLILLGPCTHDRSQLKSKIKKKKKNSYLLFCGSILTALLLQSSPRQPPHADMNFKPFFLYEQTIV